MTIEENTNLQGDVYFVPPQDENEEASVPDNVDPAWRIVVIGGVVFMTQTFETAAGLSLFGGNYADDGSPNNPNTYWGNLLENDPAFRYVSRTQFLMRGLPATSGNLRLLKRAVEADLAWFVEQRIANRLDVSVALLGRNRVEIRVTIEARGEISEFTFTENWPAPGVEVL